MMNIGFDNEKYLQMQSAHIRERIAQFDNKLYLEFGGKLFDDFHASRVLPGFQPDSKMRMLMQLSDQAEIVIVISAEDIEKNKVRGDLGITYDVDVLRLMSIFEEHSLFVGSVVITKYSGQQSASLFKNKLEKLGIKVYLHYPIEGYPSNIPHIVSDEGYGKNEFIETSRPLIVVTAPGPGSGKMAVCLSQLYHEHKRGICAGYAKFETFPIWNIPVKHPVNLAYEAATADLADVNMIDLLKAVGRTKKPILLKRGMSATIQEWIMAAEYIMSEGNPNVIFCERGIRTFETYTRNTLDLSVVPIIKERTHLPIIIDPSHAAGDYKLIESLSLAAIAAGADGLIIEVHDDPENAWSDGAQSLKPKRYADLVQKGKAIAKVIGREL